MRTTEMLKNELVASNMTLQKLMRIMVENGYYNESDRPDSDLWEILNSEYITFIKKDDTDEIATVNFKLMYVPKYDDENDSYDEWLGESVIKILDIF